VFTYVLNTHICTYIQSIRGNLHTCTYIDEHSYIHIYQKHTHKHTHTHIYIRKIHVTHIQAREEAATAACEAAARGEVVEPHIKYALQLSSLKDMGFPGLFFCLVLSQKSMALSQKRPLFVGLFLERGLCIVGFSFSPGT